METMDIPPAAVLGVLFQIFLNEAPGHQQYVSRHLFKEFRGLADGDVSPWQLKPSA